MKDIEKLFIKKDTQVHELRPELDTLSRKVVLSLYEFIESHDVAMLTEREFEKIRNRVTKELVGVPPRNIELIKAYRSLLEEGSIEQNEDVLSLLIKRKVRTLSGIANITVLMKEYYCPGKCIFCPTQPGMPKSYFSTQPAMMRAVRNNFSAYLQVKARMNGLKSQGHDVSKIDIRIAGGTFSAYPLDYQEEFIKGIYYALNEGVGEINTENEVILILEKLSLEQLISENEKADSRCVGLWIETRPDWVTIPELVKIRRFGVTGIELGIQTTDDKVNLFNKRGHGLNESIKATELCRNVGLKICHHIMPNLPSSDIQSDLQTVKDLFQKDILCPDYIKIYPCMVLPFTELSEMYEKDPTIFTPYTDEQLIEILITMKKNVPEYCRIIRLLRDFPSEIILQGSKTLNIRQILQKKCVVCRCVRCREIKDGRFDISKVQLVERSYFCNGGKEYFLSFEDVENDKIIALLRLRIPQRFDSELLKSFPELVDSALIRELHVYGQKQSLNERGGITSQTQHVGFGKKLLQRAEEIVIDNNLHKVAVISAIGTREYYEKKAGYIRCGTYMVKDI